MSASEPWDAAEVLGHLRASLDLAIAGEAVTWSGPTLMASRILSISPDIPDLLACAEYPAAAVLEAAWLLGIEQGFRLLASEGDVYEALLTYLGTRPGTGLGTADRVVAALTRRVVDPGGVAGAPESEGDP